MTKLAGLLIAAAAFAVAFYLVARRRVPLRGHGRFALLVAGFVALLGGCRSGEAPKSPPKHQPAAPSEPAPTPQAIPQPAATPAKSPAELTEIRKRWLAVPKLKDTNYDQMKQVIAAKKAECAKLLSGLVQAKAISARGAATFKQIYGDRIYHQLRQRAASCYDPTMLGAKVQTTREALEKRLKLLAGLRAKGALKPAVQQKVERGLKRQLELLLRVQILWDKQTKTKSPDWKKLRVEEQAILALFSGKSYADVTIKDAIKVRPGVEEAMGLIVQLYN